MAVFNSAVLTARGNELLVDAVAGDKIIFTRMVVGCGEYSDGERERRALEKVTALKDVRQEFTFSAHKKVSEQCVLLTAVISNRELEHSYKITEIGIYGKRSEDEEDFLCSIAVTKSLEESDTFPPYNGLQECQIVQDYYVTISPDAEVSVNTQGACVLREEFENLRAVFIDMLNGKVDKSAVANNLTTTVGGFWLDARQGKSLKDMIDAANLTINNLKQSFLGGCKKIVDKLTALGYTPNAPQGPDEINIQIQTIYDDRYAAGREQGHEDVKANPSAYGIDIGYTIEQMKVGISSHAWTGYDAYSRCFTAPNDGVLVVGNTVHAGVGVIWGAEGTHEISVTYKGQVILSESVNVYGGPNGYAQNNPYAIITDQQYPLKAGEQLIVKAKFTGKWMVNEEGDHTSGTICSFGGNSALTWVHIYS